MRKRLILGVASAALMAAMLPGVASATASSIGFCVKAGVFDRAADPASGRGPGVATKNGTHAANGEPFVTSILCA